MKTDIFEDVKGALRECLNEQVISVEEIKLIQEAKGVEDWWDKLPGKLRKKVTDILGLGSNSSRKLFSKLDSDEQSEIEAYFSKHKGKVESIDDLNEAKVGKTSKKLTPENLKIVQSKMTKVTMPAKALKLYSDMVTVRKNDPGYSITRLNARLAIEEMVLRIALQLQKGKSVNVSWLQKERDALLNEYDLFTEWYEKELFEFGKLMIPYVSGFGIIKSVKEDINVFGTDTPGDSNSEAAKFAVKIKKTIQKHMPPGHVLKCDFAKDRFKPENGHIYIVTTLEQKDKWTNGIIENDRALQKFFILGMTSDGKLKDSLSAELLVGGSLMVKPEPGSHYAFGKVKFGWRNKKGTPAQIEKHFDSYFAKVAKVIKDNKDNISESIESVKDLRNTLLDEAVQGQYWGRRSSDSKIIKMKDGEAKSIIMRPATKKAPSDWLMIWWVPPEYVKAGEAKWRIEKKWIKPLWSWESGPYNLKLTFDSVVKEDDDSIYDSLRERVLNEAREGGIIAAVYLFSDKVDEYGIQ